MSFYITENEFDIKNNRHYEGLFCLGNGYIHTRASVEEGFENDDQSNEYMRLPTNTTLEKFREGKSKWGTYMPGFMAMHPLLKEEIVNLPYFLDLKVYIDGQRFTLEGAEIVSYERTLDMKNALLIRRMHVRFNGNELNLYFERFLSAGVKNLSAQKLCIASEVPCKIDIVGGIDAGVRTNGFNHFTQVKILTKDFPCLEIESNKGEICHICSKLVGKAGLLSSFEDTVYTGEKLHFENSNAVSVYKFAAISSSRDDFDCFATLQDALKAGYDRLKMEHCVLWQKAWESADIEIKGDERSQFAVRVAIYHLMRNRSDDPRVSVCAKGYAGDAYFGRCFWDSEIFLLPFYINNFPDTAKNILLFRYNTLDGARQNANNYDYPGARYPWESSVSEVENCAVWQYADNEVHITADVCYAIRNYVERTGDMEFLEKYGLEILLETSKYWIERVSYSKDEVHLKGVMGPDEYLHFVEDDAYTNYLVSKQLLYCLEVLEQFNKEGKNVNYFWEKTGVTQEILKKIRYVGENLNYLRKGKLILQCKDFEDLDDIDFDEVWKDRTKFFGQVVSQEKNYRSKALKQADVLELFKLFPQDFDEETMRICFDYYQPLTTHDSSLSVSAYSTVASWLGRMETAKEFFDRALDIDIGYGAKEGIHIANCAGIWQAVVFGFCGLKTQKGQIKARARLPEGWESVCFRTICRGKEYKVFVSEKGEKISEIKKK